MPTPTGPTCAPTTSALAIPALAPSKARANTEAIRVFIVNSRGAVRRLSLNDLKRVSFRESLNRRRPRRRSLAPCHDANRPWVWLAYETGGGRLLYRADDLAYPLAQITLAAGA